VPEAFSAPAHGGDVAAIAGRYGAGDWLDFSANINPAGPPPGVLAALRAAAQDVALLEHYPSEHDRTLQAALARRFGWRREEIVIANGASAIIEAFVRTVAPRRCLVPQPAFSEYGRALAAQGAQTIGFRLEAADDFALDVDALLTALRDERPDACIITNPHNPSGALTPAGEMRRIRDRARELGIALLIDEAFVDYVPDASVAGDVLAADDDVLVLRSLTKFYAMPGLRVGYALASARFARALATRVPSWPVTSLAAVAAVAALEDEPYERRTRSENERARTRFAREIGTAGGRALPSAANFLQVESPLRASELTDRLARNHRIIVRDCSTYATLEGGHFVRVAVRSQEHNERLVGALSKELGSVVGGDHRACDEAEDPRAEHR
jgi:threonine-phosphate decarboxylase